ncbi:MAG: D-glycerate dehydrogenase [Candidatus Micrarchaeota archaeon]
MARIFVTRRIPEEGINLLKNKFELVIRDKVAPPTKEELIEGLKDAEGAITLLTDNLDEEVLSSASKLKIIANYAAGFDNINLSAATAKGICVTNTPGVLSETTADLAFALLLSLARRIPESDAYVKGRKWNTAWSPMLMLGADIHGKTIGIVGMGRIGFEIAKRAKGFNMKILYTNQKANPKADELGARLVPFEELLGKADFISVHVPLTKQTKHMFNSESLAKMKRTAFLINTSRGAVIDQRALAKALKGKTIAGAALDVFDEEPIAQDDELLELRNTVLVPHIGSASSETRSKMSVLAAENIISFFGGKRPPQLVNEEAWK